MKKKKKRQSPSESNVRKKVRESVAKTAKELFEMTDKLEKRSMPLRERIKDIWEGFREGFEQARKQRKSR